MVSDGAAPSKAGLPGKPGCLVKGSRGLCWSPVEGSECPKMPSVKAP